MKVLVLGAYGLIGTGVTAALLDAGHVVVGLGRSIEVARRRFPGVTWVEHDLRDLVRPGDWTLLLAGMDAVVNAAGVLQDGPADDVAVVHRDAMLALFAACEANGPARIVQISAAGASEGATTRFMTTKAEADKALSASTKLDWTIVRPGLVIAPSAYGGTALLRALAATPFILPAWRSGATIETVGLRDVASAVVACVAGEVPSRMAYDLVEDTPHTLAETLLALRGWLGFPSAPIVAFPDWMLDLGAKVGDALGRLGWRPPLRTTSLQQLRAGVTGDPAPWLAARGRGVSSLEETLRGMPAGVQERWFARLFLLKPLITGVLSLFWLASGLVALARFPLATGILTGRGFAGGVAAALVLVGALADLALGALILIRRTTAPAAAGMVVLTLVYLVEATLLVPDLWADPLGPLVKTLPGLVLALVAIAIATDR